MMKSTINDNSLTISDRDYAQWIEEVERHLLISLLEQNGTFCPTKHPLKSVTPNEPERTSDSRRPSLANSTTISILLPVFNTPIWMLTSAIESVLEQQHDHWQLCICDDASSNTEIHALLRDYQASDSRISIEFHKQNRGIAQASNTLLSMATGEYIALLDHDDILSKYALAYIARAIQDNPGAKILYTNSDCLNEMNQRVEPYFKPAWNRELLLGQNYINHLTVYHTDSIRRLGGWSDGYTGSQDYELLLRLSELVSDAEVIHIPHILYHWRQVPNSVSRSDLKRATESARRAVSDHLSRLNYNVKVAANPESLIYQRVDWRTAPDEGRPPRTQKEIAVYVFGSELEQVRHCKAAMQTDPLRYNLSWLTMAPDPSADVPLTNTEHDLAKFVEHASHLGAEIVCIISAYVRPAKPDSLERLLGIALHGRSIAVGGRMELSTGSTVAPNQTCVEIQPSSKYQIVPATANKGYQSLAVLDQEVRRLFSSCLVLSSQSLSKIRGGTDPLSWSIESTHNDAEPTAVHDRLIWAAQAPFRSIDGSLDTALIQFAE